MNRFQFRTILRNDRPRKDGSLGVYVYAKINGKNTYFSTGYSVQEKHFNKRQEEIKATAKDWSLINNRINAIKTRLINHVSLCDFEGRLTSKEELHNLFRLGFSEEMLYADFVRNYIDKFKSKYSWRTILIFEVHINKVNDCKKHLKLEEVNAFFWRTFETHLKQKGNKTNTIHKQSRLLKKFLNKAVEFGVIKENKLKSLKVQNKAGNRTHLTPDNLKKLEALHQCNTMKPGMKNVLHYFLFACYTGLRYSDVEGLRYKNIIDQSFIDIEMNKGERLVEIPLSEKAKRLISFPGLPNAKVFRVYVNQVTNRYLSKILDIAGVEQKNITFHSSRNTWATITLELTGDISLVSSVLGHTSIKTTQIYAKVLESKKRAAMAQWDAM